MVGVEATQVQQKYTAQHLQTRLVWRNGKPRKRSVCELCALFGKKECPHLGKEKPRSGHCPKFVINAKTRSEAERLIEADRVAVLPFGISRLGSLVPRFATD